MSEKKTEKQVKQEPKNTLQGVVGTNPGEPIAPVYKRVFDSVRNKNVVKKVDETNLFEFIQASKSETDLALLQKRFIALGEIPAVDPTMGSNDLTIFPQDIHGLYEMVSDISKSFAHLPENVQKIFGTAEAYGKAVLDGTYVQKINDGYKALADTNASTDGGENNE